MNPKEEKFPCIVMLKLSSENDFLNSFQDNYHTHLLCNHGSLTFSFNDIKMKCKSGEFLFWFADSKLSDIQFSKGFKATVLLVEKHFLYDNVPDQNLSIDATLHSRQYPVLQLNDQDDKQRVLANFQLLHDKFQYKEHRFYEEALKLQMKLFILEMWHTFTKEFELRKRSLQTGTLYEQFMNLVELHCLKEREVQFYASQLHITAKYLNHISKQNSDITASEWIQRYAKERIVLLLENKQMNIAEIADEMEFSSRSFFTRYVKKVLGVTPSEFRNRIAGNSSAKFKIS